MERRPPKPTPTATTLRQPARRHLPKVVRRRCLDRASIEDPDVPPATPELPRPERGQIPTKNVNFGYVPDYYQGRTTRDGNRLARWTRTKFYEGVTVNLRIADGSVVATGRERRLPLSKRSPATITSRSRAASTPRPRTRDTTCDSPPASPSLSNDHRTETDGQSRLGYRANNLHQRQSIRDDRVMEKEGATLRSDVTSGRERPASTGFCKVIATATTEVTASTEHLPDKYLPSRRNVMTVSSRPTRPATLTAMR